MEPENPLRTAEMTLEDDYGMIDGVLNNGRRGDEPVSYTLLDVYKRQGQGGEDG